jgi:hypothetical protein
MFCNGSRYRMQWEQSMRKQYISEPNSNNPNSQIGRTGYTGMNLGNPNQFAPLTERQIQPEDTIESLLASSSESK